MQASLAMVGFGLAAWWWQGGTRYGLGAVAILAPWPWTLVIKPVNDRLKATTRNAPASKAGP